MINLTDEEWEWLKGGGYICYEWFDRHGSYNSYKFPLTDNENPNEVARRGGWPGHSGGWWNWLKDDIREYVQKY